MKKEFDKKGIMNEEGPRIEKFLTYNYNDIKTIHFTKVVINPTGIPHIQGYVNDNKEYYFSASIGTPHFNTGVSFSKNWVPKKFGDSTIKTLEEIETEEKSK
ncbi:DUF1433 domain-containing protein [Isobaculum melis]|uniref:DUF1433 domain-containing protein n=1 Tax=Isobaculum melis TaxID=142588 RepID=UPI0015A6FC7B|nr:DUF1433 domain-containing protein [Isobaculum melis]